VARVGAFANPKSGAETVAAIPRFYVELQHHIGPEQNSINPHLIRLARELSLPLVCDNDAHFLKAEDHDAHDTLICISTGKNKTIRTGCTTQRSCTSRARGDAEMFEASTTRRAGREAWPTACASPSAAT
jgi:DNA polymerase III alpha subunit